MTSNITIHYSIRAWYMWIFYVLTCRISLRSKTSELDREGGGANRKLLLVSWNFYVQLGELKRHQFIRLEIKFA